MRKHTQILLVLFAVLISIILPGAARAQSDDSNYAFVVFETTVTREGVETSDTNPEERRFYISNVVEFPETDPSVFRKAPKIADDYFTANVVEPLKSKGILHQYYDDAIHINNSVVYRLDTKAEVEELKEKTLQELKERGANVFTFTWTRGDNPKGLETSQPTLFYHEPGKPLYGMSDAKTAVSPSTADTVAPTKKRQRKN